MPLVLAPWIEPWTDPIWPEEDQYVDASQQQFQEPFVIVPLIPSARMTLVNEEVRIRVLGYRVPNPNYIKTG